VSAGFLAGHRVKKRTFVARQRPRSPGARFLILARAASIGLAVVVLTGQFFQSRAPRPASGGRRLITRGRPNIAKIRTSGRAAPGVDSGTSKAAMVCLAPVTPVMVIADLLRQLPVARLVTELSVWRATKPSDMAASKIPSHAARFLTLARVVSIGAARLLTSGRSSP